MKNDKLLMDRVRFFYAFDWSKNVMYEFAVTS